MLKNVNGKIVFVKDEFVTPVVGGATIPKTKLVNVSLMLPVVLQVEVDSDVDVNSMSAEELDSLLGSDLEDIEVFGVESYNTEDVAFVVAEDLDEADLCDGDCESCAFIN